MDAAKNSLFGGGKKAWSPLDNTGGKKKISKETRKKVSKANRAGGKAGDKAFSKEAGKVQGNKGDRDYNVMRGALLPQEQAQGARSMARANRKYAKSSGASKEMLKAMKKDFKKSGAGKASTYAKANRAESKKAWSDHRSAKRAAKANPSKENLSKLTKAQKQKRLVNNRSKERVRRKLP